MLALSRFMPEFLFDMGLNNEHVKISLALEDWLFLMSLWTLGRLMNSVHECST